MKNHYTLPGVYYGEVPRLPGEVMRLEEDCTAGFVGFTERGPFHEPVRLRSFSDYIKHFGSPEGGRYLPDSVKGFFLNRGRECIVVRIAHFSEDKIPGSICHSSLLLEDSESYEPFIKIESLIPGDSGNKIRVKLWHTAANVLPTQAVGDKMIKTTDPDSYTPGEVLVIRKEQNFCTRFVTTVSASTITLNLPLPDNMISGILFHEKVRLNFSFINDKIKEDHIDLSPNKIDTDYFARRINQKSSLIRIKIKNLKEKLPRECVYERLTGGDDGITGARGIDFLGKYNGPDNKNGLAVLDGIDDIRLLLIPDLLCLFENSRNKKEALRDIAVVWRGMIAQCEKHKNRFALLDIPPFENPVQASNWISNFDTMYACCYYPLLTIVKDHKKIKIPPSGYMAGIFSYVDENFGIHHSTANRKIEGIEGLSQELFIEESALLTNAGINCFKYQGEKTGVRAWGSRTLSSDPEWNLITVRRTFTAVENALKQGTVFAMFEPCSEELMLDLTTRTTLFLTELWQKGYLAGNSAEEAFYVFCNDEVNPPETLDLGIIILRVGLAIAKPAEFFTINLSLNTGSAEV